MKKATLLLPFFALIFFSCHQNSQQNDEEAQQIDSLLIDYVWSGHPVGFSLVTKPPFQYVAYYDSSRNMTIAQRALGTTEWAKARLPEKVGWDSHNYIAMAVDKHDFVHVSGNMHGDTLVYFKSGEPADITTLERVESLVGDHEDRVTYPLFFESPEEDLIFQYRIGSSGKGNQIFNRYDPDKEEWSRLIDQPLVDGKGEMNAYLHGPIQGPDDYYHLVWVWRDTPDAATNHDLSYAKSKNLVDWFKSSGERQSIPITYENGEIIDPVPAGGGMLNGNTKIGFDQKNRPVISYHKFDQEGNTQIYNARLENNSWKIYQTTDWKFRWEFGGRGSLNSRIGLYPVVNESGQLTQKYFIDSVGMEKIRLDDETLKEKEKLPDDRHPYVRHLEKVNAEFKGMRVNMKVDKVNEKDLYVLRWETLRPRNDKPLEGKIPEPQPLKLFHIRTH